VEVLPGGEVVLAHRGLPVRRRDDAGDDLLVLAVHDPDADLHFVGEPVTLVEEHVTGLAAVDDLEIADVYLVADNPETEQPRPPRCQPRPTVRYQQIVENIVAW
jgi:hypothetical protein